MRIVCTSIGVVVRVEDEQFTFAVPPLKATGRAGLCTTPAVDGKHCVQDIGKAGGWQSR